MKVNFWKKMSSRKIKKAA